MRKIEVKGREHTSVISKRNVISQLDGADDFDRSIEFAPPNSVAENYSRGSYPSNFLEANLPDITFAPGFSAQSTAMDIEQQQPPPEIYHEPVKEQEDVAESLLADVPQSQIYSTVRDDNTIKRAQDVGSSTMDIDNTQIHQAIEETASIKIEHDEEILTTAINRPQQYSDVQDIYMMQHGKNTESAGIHLDMPLDSIIKDSYERSAGPISDDRQSLPSIAKKDGDMVQNQQEAANSAIHETNEKDIGCKTEIREPYFASKAGASILPTILDTPPAENIRPDPTETDVKVSDPAEIPTTCILKAELNLENLDRHLVGDMGTVMKLDDELSDRSGIPPSAVLSLSDIEPDFHTLNDKLANEEKNGERNIVNIEGTEPCTSTARTATRFASASTSSSLEGRIHLPTKQEGKSVNAEEGSFQASPPFPQVGLLPSHVSYPTAISQPSSQISVGKETNTEKTMERKIPPADEKFSTQEDQNTVLEGVTCSIDVAHATKLGGRKPPLKASKSKSSASCKYEIKITEASSSSQSVITVDDSQQDSHGSKIVEHPSQNPFLACIKPSPRGSNTDLAKVIETSRSNFLTPKLLEAGQVRQPSQAHQDYHGVTTSETNQFNHSQQAKAQEFTAPTGLDSKLEVAKAYDNLFLLMHTLPANLDAISIDRAIAQGYLLLRTAARHECVYIVRPHISHHLLSFGKQLFHAILEDPLFWLNFSLELECAPIFKEAMIHIVGQAPRWQRHFFESDVQNLINRKVSNLSTLKAKVNEELFKSNIRVDGQDLTLFNIDKSTYGSWYAVRIWQ